MSMMAKEMFEHTRPLMEEAIQKLAIMISGKDAEKAEVVLAALHAEVEPPVMRLFETISSMVDDSSKSTLAMVAHMLKEMPQEVIEDWGLNATSEIATLLEPGGEWYAIITKEDA